MMIANLRMLTLLDTAALFALLLVTLRLYASWQ
jgi:hypothetical protein